ncbi:hypothetical protein ACGFNU_39925 [Spirillospora sp. NPDC048911]|uniref:hypothetical protein n=1 Tax=Spirillospora sp. NPDC048911 TaxID=3364527 RepID=UPI003724265E
MYIYPAVGDLAALGQPVGAALGLLGLPLGMFALPQPLLGELERPRLRDLSDLHVLLRGLVRGAGVVQDLLPVFTACPVSGSFSCKSIPWLQLHTDDLDAATDKLAGIGIRPCDEVEPLEDLRSRTHWIKNPAGVIHIPRPMISYWAAGATFGSGGLFR